MDQGNRKYLKEFFGGVINSFLFKEHVAIRKKRVASSQPHVLLNLGEVIFQVRSDTHGARGPLGRQLTFVVTVQLKTEYLVFLHMEIVVAELMHHKLCDEHTRHHSGGQAQNVYQREDLIL